MKIKVNLVNQYDDETNYLDILKLAAKGVAKVEKGKSGIINIILVDNAEIQKINKQYRKKDYPTDVISFPNDDDRHEIGDIFISIDKAKEQADEFEHSFKRELAFLAIHGMLHCLGYDHIEKEDELIMIQHQKQIFEKIKISR